MIWRSGVKINLLLITAVKIMDEYYETKKKVDQKKQQLETISSKI